MTSTVPKDIALLAGIFTVSGVTHLVRPEVFEPLMPAWVPRHREVIVWSGVVELGCAAGLLRPTTRARAGLLSTAVLLGVYPGNIKMAVDASRTRSTKFKAIAYGRLPLQLPLLRIAWRAGR